MPSIHQGIQEVSLQTRSLFRTPDSCPATYMDVYHPSQTHYGKYASCHWSGQPSKLRQESSLGGANTFSWKMGHQEKGTLHIALRPESRARIGA
jgi:hypothetical protein